VALYRHTGQSRPVAISSGRYRNDAAQCRSDSGDTIVVEGGHNLVDGLASPCRTGHVSQTSVVYPSIVAPRKKKVY